MTQENVNRRNAVAYLGIESTLGTTPSMTRAEVIEGSFEPNAVETDVEVTDERVHLADYQTPVRGLKYGGGCKFGLYARPPAAQISGTTTATHFLGLLCKATFGGESATGSSAVDTGTSATVFSVTAGHGVRFDEGQTIYVGVSGILYPARIKSISTDEITLAYALPGTPASGQLVIGGYNYYLTQTNTQTLAFQHGLIQSNNFDWTFNGCTGSLSFELTTNELIKVMADLKSATHTGPADASLTKTTAAETSRPIALRDYFFLFQPVATTARTHVPIEKISFEFQFGMDHVRELATGESNSVESVIAAMRMGSVKPFCKVKVTQRADVGSGQAIHAHANQTPMQLALHAFRGSGTSRRFAGLDVGTGQIVGKPTHPNGDRELIEWTLCSQLDTSTSGSTSDLALSPARFCVG